MINPQKVIDNILPKHDKYSKSVINKEICPECGKKELMVHSGPKGTIEICNNEECNYRKFSKK